MAAGDLTSLEKLKAYLGAKAADDDLLLADVITRASQWFVSQVNTPIVSATYNETRSGRGSTRLYPEHEPVTSVTSVTVEGTPIPARLTTDGDGWVLDEGAIQLVNYTFTVGFANIVIVYVAEYAVIPADIEGAVIEIAAAAYRRKNHVDVFSQSMNGETTQFQTLTIPATIQTVIDRYRRYSVG